MELIRRFVLACGAYQAAFNRQVNAVRLHGDRAANIMRVRKMDLDRRTAHDRANKSVEAIDRMCAKYNIEPLFGGKYGRETQDFILGIANSSLTVQQFDGL